MPGTALVIGGSGPSGPWVIDGLREEGWTVTMLHTGRHKPDRAWYAGIDKVITNPFDPAATAAALRGRRWDLAVVLYGRLAELAAVLVPHAARLISVGGFVVYRHFALPDAGRPPGLPVPVRETSPLSTATGERGGEPDHPNRKIRAAVAAEEAVFRHFPGATHLRYPLIYGPGQVAPDDWGIVRRLLDGRTRIIVADGGHSLIARCYARNAARAVVLAAARPAACRGRAYNVADDACLTVRQRIDTIAAALGRRVEVVSLPGELAAPARPALLSESAHHVLLSTEALRRDVGYEDAVPAAAAAAETARWLRDHPVPEEVSRRILHDPFDYAAEDELIAAWRRGDVAACRAVRWRDFEPGYGSFYYGSAPNPAVPGLRQADRHRGEWTSLPAGRL